MLNELITRAKAGDKQARDELYERFHGFVVRFVIDWASRIGLPYGEPLDDYIQEGLMAIDDAIRRYDAARTKASFPACVQYAAHIRVSEYYCLNKDPVSISRRTRHRVTEHAFKERTEVDERTLGTADGSDAAHRACDTARVRRALAKLDERIARILYEWASERDMASIAKELGISRQRATQLRDRGLKQLRQAIINL